jgi:hypothetical protein
MTCHCRWPHWLHCPLTLLHSLSPFFLLSLSGGAVFAELVTASVPAKFAPFFFRQGRALLADNVGFDASFLEWLKKNYTLKGLKKLWTETQIAEFVREERIQRGEMTLVFAGKGPTVFGCLRLFGLMVRSQVRARGSGFSVSLS